MKQTVLELVQDILSDMSDDNVNSINDSLESLQVAQIVKSTFYELIGNKNWPHLKKLSTLRMAGDSTKPTHMVVGENVKELLSVEYDKRETNTSTELKYKEVPYVLPDDFLAQTNYHKTTDTDVISVADYSGAVFNIKTDQHPTCYTSFDDEHVVFNSYDSAVEDTLQETRNRIWVVESPSFSMVDTHVPDLPEEAFPALLAEAKSSCFARLKQMEEGKSEQQSRRQRNWLSRKAFKVDGGIKLPDYSKGKR